MSQASGRSTSPVDSLASSFVSLSVSQTTSSDGSTPGRRRSTDEFIVLSRSAASLSSGAGGQERIESSVSSGSVVDYRTDDEDEAEVDAVLGRTSATGSHLSASVSSADTLSSASGTPRRRPKPGKRQRDAARKRAGSVSGSSAASTATSGSVARPTRGDEDDVESVLDESVWSEDYASESIDEFFNQTALFAGGGSESKLRLWQALCIEFGLCEAPGSVSSSVSSSASSSSRPSSSASSDDEFEDRALTPTRSRTPTQRQYNAFPTSLTQAKHLLKTQAFVNLKDFVARNTRQHGEGDEAFKKRRSKKQDLLFPSKSSLRRYTISNKKTIKLGAAKSSFLDPLLQEMYSRY